MIAIGTAGCVMRGRGGGTFAATNAQLSDDRVAADEPAKANDNTRADDTAAEADDKPTKAESTAAKTDDEEPPNVARKQGGPPDEIAVNRPLTFGFVGVGSFLWLGSDRLWQGTLQPKACRLICEPDGVNAFDREVGNALEWNDKSLPDTVALLSAYVGVPVVAVGGLTLASLVQEDRREYWLNDMLVVAESTVATGLFNRMVALGVARTRPRARDLPPGEVVAPDDRQAYESFFSGHTSAAFSVGISAAMVASLRHYRVAPWLWGGAIVLGSMTAYMRLASVSHYPTDVLAGAVAGTAFGIGVPLLHRVKRVPRIELAPLQDGGALSLSGAW